MRAIVCHALRGPDALELADLPVPEPGACGVRIRVRAAGRELRRQPDAARASTRRSRPCRSRPGLELAGEIEAVGAGVRGLAPGQRVLAVVSHGAFAEQAVARAEDVVPLPDDMDDVTAAGFAIAYGTAQGALRWRADLQAGEMPCRARCGRRRRPDRGRVRQGDRCHGHRHRARRGKARGGARRMAPTTRSTATSPT